MVDITTAVSETALDVSGAIGVAGSEDCGGIGVFVGTVRTSPAAPGAEKRSVVRLEYEAHAELAEQRLDEIARQAADRFGLQHVVAVHRTGPCELGEPTVVVACGAAHRAEALDGCRWIIDEIKSTVPIWKREVYSDGSAWVGAEGR